MPVVADDNMKGVLACCRSSDTPLGATPQSKRSSMVLSMSKKALRAAQQQQQQQDISLAVESISAQVCPAAVRQLQALELTFSKASPQLEPHGKATWAVQRFKYAMLFPERGGACATLSAQHTIPTADAFRGALHPEHVSGIATLAVVRL